MGKGTGGMGWLQEKQQAQEHDQSRRMGRGNSNAMNGVGNNSLICGQGSSTVENMTCISATLICHCSESSLL